MGLDIRSKKNVETIEPKNFYLDLPKHIDKNLKYEVDFMIKIRNF